ncbi:hypothetical protein BY996DRAFT_1996108 [Phakopsora pachyrhizi]|nr:hypothetical protein BY996DRAFT_1996108 [Phakopsora pachyrhizi]
MASPVRLNRYPWNLIVYHPIYPHVDCSLYPAIPGCPVKGGGLTIDAFNLPNVYMQKEIQDLSSPETKAGLSKEQGGFNISVRMDSYPHNLVIYAPVYPHVSAGLYSAPPGSIVTFRGLTTGFFVQKFALGLNTGLGGFKISVRMDSYPHNLAIYAPVYPHTATGLYPSIPGSMIVHGGLTNASFSQNFALGFNSSQADLKTTVRMESYPHNLIIYAPVYPYISYGLYPTIPGSIVSHKGLTNASLFQKSPVGLNKDLDGCKISKSPVGLNEDLDGSKISTLEVNEGGDEIQHKVESKEALHSNDSVIALGSIKDMSANTEERKFAFTESLILDEKKQLLFISVDSIPGYPFNLRVYPAVYPHIDELLYCAPVPSSIKKAESALNMRMVSQLDLGCIEVRCLDKEKQERELRAGLLGDDSVSVSLPKSTDVIPGVYSRYPYSLIIYPAVYPYIAHSLYYETAPRQISCPNVAGIHDYSLKKSGSESGLHQNISDRSSDDSTDTQKKTARASKHIPAPLQPFSAKEPQSPPPPESSWTERLLKSPVSIENSSLSPSFYRSGSPSSAGRIISISPSLQYTQQPRSNDSEMVTSGGSGLEIKAFGLGASFFKPKDNLVDPEAEGLTEAVEADKRSETSSFSKSESMDTDCVNSRQLTEEDWPPTPTSLSRFPGDGPSKNGEFRATPLNSISPRDASSVDYCESGRAYIESDHEIRIKPLSEASAITPTIAEFHEAAKRDNCAQASSVSEKFYSGEETPRSNTICADEFEESLTRGTRMVFSQQTNVESYPTGYLNSLGIQLSGPTIQTDHDIRQVSLAEASAISPTIASFHADLKVWPEASNLEAERKMPPATGHSIEKLFVAEDSAPTPKLTNQMRTLKEMDSIDPAVEPISPPRQPSPDLSQRLESAEAGGDASSQFPGYEKMDSISSNSEYHP